MHPGYKTNKKGHGKYKEGSTKSRNKLGRSLCQVPVRRHRRILHPLEILPRNQIFYPLLDHRYLGFEAARELREDLRDELRVHELLSLSVRVVLAIVCTRSAIPGPMQGMATYFMIRTMAASITCALV